MNALSEATFTLRAACSLTAYDPVVCSELYQIAREALMNAARHSGATAIVTSITASPASLRLDVSDNGRGIEPELLLAGGRRGHWGLLGMRERARQIGSEIRITSFLGAGTVVSSTATCLHELASHTIFFARAKVSPVHSIPADL
jgi:signal transduction histidine kinase